MAALRSAGPRLFSGRKGIGGEAEVIEFSASAVASARLTLAIHIPVIDGVCCQGCATDDRFDKRMVAHKACQAVRNATVILGLAGEVPPAVEVPVMPNPLSGTCWSAVNACR